MAEAAEPEARRLWIRDPLAILADGAGGGIVVAGSRIVEHVAAGARPAGPVAETFDASRHVVIPGLINTHHHAFQTLTRAHPIAINKPLFPWLKALYTVWGRITPEAFRLATRVAYTELLLSGCTTAGDHHYLFPKGLEDSVDVQVDEARSLGIRAAITRGSMSLSDRDGGLPPETLTQDDDTILADCERVLNLFHDPAPGAMVQVGARAVLALRGDPAPDARERGAGRPARMPPAHPSRRDARRGRVLPVDVRLPPGGLPGAGRLDDRPGLARPRHPFQRCRGRPARQGRGRRVPLPDLQHDPGVGPVPHLRAGGGGLAPWAWASTARPPTTART